MRHYNRQAVNQNNPFHQVQSFAANLVQRPLSSTVINYTRHLPPVNKFNNLNNIQNINIKPSSPNRAFTQNQYSQNKNNIFILNNQINIPNTKINTDN